MIFVVYWKGKKNLARPFLMKYINPSPTPEPISKMVASGSTMFETILNEIIFWIYYEFERKKLIKLISFANPVCISNS